MWWKKKGLFGPVTPVATMEVEFWEKLGKSVEAPHT
jgi:hypothetical protein